VAKSRFDLEQDIMNCWHVVDDINMLVGQGSVTEENVQAIATLYTQRFECLWQTFEDCIHNKFGYFPELPNQLNESKQDQE